MSWYDILATEFRKEKFNIQIRQLKRKDKKCATGKNPGDESKAEKVKVLFNIKVYKERLLLD